MKKVSCPFGNSSSDTVKASKHARAVEGVDTNPQRSFGPVPLWSR